MNKLCRLCCNIFYPYQNGQNRIKSLKFFHVFFQYQIILALLAAVIVTAVITYYFEKEAVSDLR